MQIDNSRELNVALGERLVQPKRDIFENVNVSSKCVVEARCVYEVDDSAIVLERIDFDLVGFL